MWGFCPWLLSRTNLRHYRWLIPGALLREIYDLKKMRGRQNRRIIVKPNSNIEGYTVLKDDGRTLRRGKESKESGMTEIGTCHCPEEVRNLMRQPQWPVLFNGAALMDMEVFNCLWCVDFCHCSVVALKACSPFFSPIFVLLSSYLAEHDTFMKVGKAERVGRDAEILPNLREESLKKFGR